MLLGTLIKVSSVRGVNWGSKKLETEDICLKKKKEMENICFLKLVKDRKYFH